jgi:hypothetical protein
MGCLVECILLYIKFTNLSTTPLILRGEGAGMMFARLSNSENNYVEFKPRPNFPKYHTRCEVLGC